jgi:hypothetical protein
MIASIPWLKSAQVEVYGFQETINLKESIKIVVDLDTRK